MPSQVVFQIQTPRTFQSLTAQEALLASVHVPKDLFPGKLGIGALLSDTTTTTGPTVTRTLTYALLPIFSRIFPPPMNPDLTLGPIFRGLTLVQTRTKRAVTSISVS